MPHPIIRLTRASVLLGGDRVLRDVDWQIDADDHWLVTGPNGAGKTTFLRLLAGDVWPAPPAGSQRIYDFGDGPQHDAVRARQAIALVGPETRDRYLRMGWNLTVRDIVATGLYGSPILRVTPDPEALARTARFVADATLTDVADISFVRLSRGQQSRTLIARAMIARPRVLLLDEICDGLDQASAARVIEMIDDIAENSACNVVYSTHRPESRPQQLSRSLRIDRGRACEVSLDRQVAAPARDPKERRPESGGADVLIHIEHAQVFRDEVYVLRDIEWRLRVGSNWQIRGHNGAGKSTFLLLCYGALRPALGGHVSWAGIGDADGLAAIRSVVALVSSDLQAEYRDAVTVRDCIATGFNASIGVVPELSSAKARRLDEVIDACGLEAIASRDVRSLSYGQFRLALLARAIVVEPRVLLLDEALAGLDDEVARTVIAAVDDLIDRGTTIVLATHVHDALSDRCPNELLLDSGRIIASREVH